MTTKSLATCPNPACRDKEVAQRAEHTFSSCLQLLFGWVEGIRPIP